MHGFSPFDEGLGRYELESATSPLGLKDIPAAELEKIGLSSIYLCVLPKVKVHAQLTVGKSFNCDHLQALTCGKMVSSV